jgi:outer membrane biosynthesis protein TonB
MPSIDALPPDQRAVLELVLRRGRTYDEIAQLLSIDRAGVRQRALAALDALGPEADVPAERRALITDYLLGALPRRVTEQVRERLGKSAAERAWARVIAAELEPISSQPLPEIPADAGAVRPAPAAPTPRPEPEPERTGRPAPPRREPRSAGEPEPAPAPGEAEEPRRRRASRRERRPGRRRGPLGPGSSLEPGRERPPSRRGGKLVLLAAAVIVLVIVLSIALSGGGSKGGHTTPAAAAGTTPTTASTPSTTSTPTTASTPTTSTSATGTTSTSGQSAKIVAQVNLNAPSGGSAKGVAEVLKAGSTEAVAIIAQHVAPNKAHDAYAVWAYNSPTDAVRLGFVSPGVTSSGKLQTEGPLPANASHFHHLIITLETQSDPKTPGQIVLEGDLTGLS